MHKKRHYESKHICQQLNALVICQLHRLVNFAHYISESVSHLLVVHQRQQVAFLLDADTVRVKQASYLRVKQLAVLLFRLIIVNDLKLIKLFVLLPCSSGRKIIRFVLY